MIVSGIYSSFFDTCLLLALQHSSGGQLGTLTSACLKWSIGAAVSSSSLRHLVSPKIFTNDWLTFSTSYIHIPSYNFAILIVGVYD